MRNRIDGGRCPLWWFVSVLAAGCGPTVGADDGAEDGDAASSSAGGPPIPPAAWMSGAYSSIRMNHGNSNTVGFEHFVDRYYFREDGSFDELHDDENLQLTRTWEPLSETKVRLSRAPDESAKIKWWELDLRANDDGCPFVEWTAIDSNIVPGSGPSMYPGEVCLVQDPAPYGDAPTYHAVWCSGTPPPGCDDEGCPCDQ